MVQACPAGNFAGACAPGRVLRMLDHRPADTTVAVLREAVGDKLGVSLDGKYRHVFEKALLQLPWMHRRGALDARTGDRSTVRALRAGVYTPALRSLGTL